jgi:hypothetical protein
MDWINRHVLSMPTRLQQLKDSEDGQLIGYGGWLQPGETSRKKGDQIN